MKAITTLIFLFLFLQINAQEREVYTESGTSFFLQVGPTDNLYSKIISIGEPLSFFNEVQTSKVDRSISMGIALEIVRGNVGFRLQTNRIQIDETFEQSSSIVENSFGEFKSSNSVITHGKQINYEVVPGIHRYFQVNKWIFSGGIEMPFTIYDIYTFTQNSTSEFISSSIDFSFEQSSSDEAVSEIPGGYDIGIGSNFGLQYSVNNILKLGIQYAPSFRHYKIGGESELVRKSKQSFVEQFENETPIITNNNTTASITSTNTQSKIADFRQKMNFTLIFSF